MYWHRLNAGDERPDFSGLFVAYDSNGLSAVQARRCAFAGKAPSGGRQNKTAADGAAAACQFP